ncbi:MAG: hypothetical protein AAGA03_15690, partial [Planctomycetota bacterium]
MKTMNWMLTLAMLFALLPAVAVTADDAKKEKEMTVKVLGSGQLTVPKSFKSVPPKMSMIQAEFNAMLPDGERIKTARMTMMAAGGSVDANVARWKMQFKNGTDPKTEKMKLGSWNAQLVELEGDYAGMRSPVQKGYGMLAAILMEKEEGPKFFVKLIGPKDV